MTVETSPWNAAPFVPASRQMPQLEEACHPWLDAELDAVASSVVVALGATAERALVGKTLGIAANRGRALALGDRVVLVTYHPSAVLRGDERADELRKAIVDDLMAAREAAAEGSPK